MTSHEKILVLLRHGHAAEASSDQKRALTLMGREKVASSAKAIAALIPAAARILASTATRTQQTADILVAALTNKCAETELLDELYLASPSAYRQAITSQPSSLSALVIVGHNPGLSTLATQLKQVDIGLTPGDFVVHRFSGDWGNLSSVS